MGAISTRAIRWVSKHHGHTNKETRVWVKRLLGVAVDVAVVVRKQRNDDVFVHAAAWVTERPGLNSRRPRSRRKCGNFFPESPD